MNIDWFVWRPVIGRKATLEEIERHYSLSDLLDVHEAMDIEQEMEQFHIPKNK